MQLPKSEIARIRKQFTSNLQVLERIEAKVELLKSENAAMMKLISEVQPDQSDSLMQIKINKAIMKRNSQFK